MNGRLAGIFPRLGAVLAGYVAASLAGSLALNVIAIAVAGGDDDPGRATLALGLFVSVPYVALLVAYFALLPGLVAVAACEYFVVRRWWAHVAIGLAIALAVVLSMRDSSDANGANAALILTLAAAGAASGYVYWLVAGRRSGAWRTVISPA